MRARDLTDAQARVAAWIGGIPVEGKTRREIDAAIEGWPVRDDAPAIGARKEEKIMSDPTTNPAPAAAVTLKPNWSAVAALVRALVVLAASTFAGALMLPLASGGAVTWTWAAWRPVLAAAAGAAAAQELVYIRAHLADAAKALGLQLAAKAMLLLALLLVVLPGCTPAVAVPARDAANIAAEAAQQKDCVDQHKGDPAAQDACRADVKAHWNAYWKLHCNTEGVCQ